MHGLEGRRRPECVGLHCVTARNSTLGARRVCESPVFAGAVHHCLIHIHREQYRGVILGGWLLLVVVTVTAARGG